MGFGNLVEAIDNFDRQFAIRLVCDVFLMHGRVNRNDIFQRRFPMQTNAHRKIRSTPSAPMRLRKCTSSALCQGNFCWNSFVCKKPGNKDYASTAILSIRHSNSLTASGSPNHQTDGLLGAPVAAV